MISPEAKVDYLALTPLQARDMSYGAYALSQLASPIRLWALPTFADINDIIDGERATAYDHWQPAPGISRNDINFLKDPDVVVTIQVKNDEMMWLFRRAYHEIRRLGKPFSGQNSVTDLKSPS
jgi:hypothetical protein